MGILWSAQYGKQSEPKVIFKLDAWNWILSMIDRVNALTSRTTNEIAVFETIFALGTVFHWDTCIKDTQQIL